MSDAPKMVWATVNGARFSVPGGKSRLVGGWDEQPDERATQYVRHDIYEEVLADLRDAEDFGQTACETAERILNFLGVGHSPSREPGADARREKIAAWIDRAISAKPTTGE